MTSPDLKFLTNLDVNKIHVNEKAYENKNYGMTYNYLNYENIKDLEIQLPMFLTSNIGIKKWQNENGNVSFSTMIQFPCLDPHEFHENRKAKLLPLEKIPMKFDPDINQFRKRTDKEIIKEFQTFQQFCLLEERVRQEAKISNDLRKFNWNGVIQVRNKRDAEDNIIENEFFAPSVKFQIGTQKTNRSEIDLLCTDKETNEKVEYTEVPPFSLLNPVFTLGRMYRKTRSIPQPCGLHLYMTRVMFYRPKILNDKLNNEEEEDIGFTIKKNTHFLNVEEEEENLDE